MLFKNNQTFGKDFTKRCFFQVYLKEAKTILHFTKRKTKIMKPYFTLLSCCFLMATFHCFAQSDFEIPDTICIGQTLDINYSGDPIQSVCLVSEANFFNYDISVDAIPTFPDTQSPLFSHVVQNEDNYYLFSTIFDNDTVVRLDFGNSLNNAPTENSFSLGIISKGQEGIQILNDNGYWWGFIVGGWAGAGLDDEFLLRLDFGNDLTSIPTVENLGNLGNLAFPHDLFFTKENDNWVGVAVNKTGHSITRFSFGNDLSSNPVATDLGNLGNLFFPTGFSPIRVEGNWYFFVTNTGDNSLSRIDFGNSLLNTPTGVNLGMLDFLDFPRDMTITKVCDNFLGLLLNKTGGEMLLLDFSDDIESTPSISSIGNIGGFIFPHSITQSQITDEGVVIFINSTDSKEISRIDFTFPLGLDVTCDTSISNLNVSYPSEGIYTLQLLLDDGLPTQSSFCKDIFVIPPPDLDLGKDTIVCFDTPVKLESNFANTVWENDLEGSFFEATEAGFYTAEIMVGDCAGIDTIEVIYENCESCYLFPNAFTPDGDLVNDLFQPVIECEPELQTFDLSVFNRWGQKVFQSNNPSDGWDGNFNGKNSVSDVYVWKMIYTYAERGEVLEKVKMGDVTLIR